MAGCFGRLPLISPEKLTHLFVFLRSQPPLSMSSPWTPPTPHPPYETRTVWVPPLLPLLFSIPGCLHTSLGLWLACWKISKPGVGHDIVVILWFVKCFVMDCLNWGLIKYWHLCQNATCGSCCVADFPKFTQVVSRWRQSDSELLSKLINESAVPLLNGRFFIHLRHNFISFHYVLCQWSWDSDEICKGRLKGNPKLEKFHILHTSLNQKCSDIIERRQLEWFSCGGMFLSGLSDCLDSKKKRFYGWLSLFYVLVSFFIIP